MASRSGKRTLEDQSWTESPAAAVAVVLVTVPDTVTLPLGVAYVGLTDVIMTDSGWAGLACPGPAGRFPPGHPYPLPSMPVPDSHDLTPGQRRAAAALLRETAAPVAALAQRFARQGHELALVGGSVRDVFLGRAHGDLDLTTDARPEQVLQLAEGWADAVWEIGIDFGTVGLRKGSTICEITTYRSESYRYDSRKPKVDYGTSLEDDLSRRDFTVNAMAARLPSLELADPFGGLTDLRAKVL